MAFVATAIVAGNLIGTATTQVLCVVSSTIRFTQSERTCLLVPAQLPGQTEWRPTAVAVDRVNNDILVCETPTLSGQPLEPIPVPATPTPAFCHNVVPHGVVTATTSQLTLTWWVDATIDIPAVGVTSIPVRSQPTVTTCGLSSSGPGEWTVSLSVSCLGCFVIRASPTLAPPIHSPANAFTAVTRVGGNTIGVRS
jgi:hypothetical protein